MATKAVRIPSAAASFLGVSEQLFLQQRCTYKEERVARTRHGRSMVKHYFEVMYPPPPKWAQRAHELTLHILYHTRVIQGTMGASYQW